MNGFPIFDLLLIAGVAIFLVLRLGSVLGKRTGHENPPKAYKEVLETKKAADDFEPEEKVVPLPSLKERHDREFDDQQMEGPLHDGYAAIREHDPSFSPAKFLEGARAAFEWILRAYVEGDRETLRSLLSDDVYKSFEGSIAQRESLGHRIEEMLIGIDKADVIEAEMQGSKAVITLKIVSKQVNVVYDNLDAIVSGDPQKVIDITDIWTFCRDTKYNDPNWILTATRSPS